MKQSKRIYKLKNSSLYAELFTVSELKEDENNEVLMEFDIYEEKEGEFIYKKPIDFSYIEKKEIFSKITKSELEELSPKKIEVLQKYIDYKKEKNKELIKEAATNKGLLILSIYEVANQQAIIAYSEKEKTFLSLGWINNSFSLIPFKYTTYIIPACLNFFKKEHNKRKIYIEFGEYGLLLDYNNQLNTYDALVINNIDVESTIIERCYLSKYEYHNGVWLNKEIPKNIDEIRKRITEMLK